MISIDTRTIKKGEYFVPIVGPNFDGNKYIDDAIKKGAKGIISEENFYKLTKSKLDKKRPFVIAVAGSIGKSTFRSYLYSVLKTKYSVLESDQNTKLGFALKILNDLKNQKIIVAEIGIDRIGEMNDTASFVNPDLSVITKLGKEHLEFFKTFKNVVIEESKILEFTKSKTVYINSKDKKDFIKFGLNIKKLDCYDTKNISNNIAKLTDGFLIPEHDKIYLNGICYIVKKYFKFTDIDLVKGLKNLIKPKGRANIIELNNGSIVIDDAYNAVCDQTIIEGIKFASKIAKTKSKRLNIVISSMRENGESKIIQHRNVAKYINKCKFYKLILFGDDIELYSNYIKSNHVKYRSVADIVVKPTSEDLFYIKSANYFKGYELVNNLVNSI